MSHDRDSVANLAMGALGHDQPDFFLAMAHHGVEQLQRPAQGGHLLDSFFQKAVSEQFRAARVHQFIEERLPLRQNEQFDVVAVG